MAHLRCLPFFCNCAGAQIRCLTTPLFAMITWLFYASCLRVCFGLSCHLVVTYRAVSFTLFQGLASSERSAFPRILPTHHILWCALMLLSILTSFHTAVKKKNISSKHPVLHWLISYATDQITRRQVGADGKTPHQRLKGRTFRKLLPVFAEHVLYLWIVPRSS